MFNLAFYRYRYEARDGLVIPANSPESFGIQSLKNKFIMREFKKWKPVQLSWVKIADEQKKLSKLGQV